MLCLCGNTIWRYQVETTAFRLRHRDLHANHFLPIKAGHWPDMILGVISPKLACCDWTRNVAVRATFESRRARACGTRVSRSKSIDKLGFTQGLLVRVILSQSQTLVGFFPAATFCTSQSILNVFVWLYGSLKVGKLLHQNCDQFTVNWARTKQRNPAGKLGLSWYYQL